MTNEDIDPLLSRILLEVEAVQLEQMVVLHCLARHHGLRRVFAEGLTPKDVPNFKDRIAVLREMEEKDVPRLRRQLADARELKLRMAAAGREKSERYQQADAIERKVARMLEEHEHRLLEVGAAGRLLIAGEIEEVFPLDDADLMDQARPVTPAGKVRLEPDKVKAREDAQVGSALARGPFALVILGGAHDLSDSVRRLGGGRCQYTRVTTRRVKEFMGDVPR